MSSIAYVTERKMIEYHRVNGNRSLNFWRPSASIRFSDFHKGDLLFFLAKGTEKGKGASREKGIVGYGKYVDGEILTPSLAWKRYQTKNGYSTKDEFFDVIMKASKDKELPENISCLHLSDVVFFQAPIYLSEIGIQISNNVESYIYLDKDDDTATIQILEKAKDVGIDLWSLSFDDHEEENVFEYAQKYEVVGRICSFLNDEKMSEREEKQLYKVSYKYLIEHENDDLDFVKGSKIDLCSITPNGIKIYAPLVYTNKDKNQRIQRVIGKLLSYKALLEIDPYSKGNIEVHAITDSELEEGLVLWMETSGVIVEVE
ncbi:MAG: hypothetical protein IKM20_09105 [Erysipelotrichales bacterium]|nr:hypothetical protein [Erysipelotrichales bacterium]